MVASAETLSDLSRFSVLTSNQGCWSGWEVAFDPRTGRPVALDEAYVPEELLEWGAPPLGWEVFSRDGARGANWERTAFRVVPEAGCAADECSVSVLTFGLDLAAASVVATRGGRVAAVDSCRYPSGECGELLAAASPFVEVRTIFARDGAGPEAGGLLARYDRVRVDLKFDARACALVKCVVSCETKDACDAPPYSSPARRGSSRARGLEASDVSRRCGEVFVGRDDGEAAFAPDGSATLTLGAGAVRLAYGPLAAAAGSFLDVSLPAEGLGFRREIAADGALLACEAAAASAPDEQIR